MPVKNETNNTTRKILLFLFENNVFAWRSNTAGIPLKGGGMRGAAKTGVPDILVILPGTGRFLGIEVKTGNDKMSPTQLGFRASVLRQRGIFLEVKTYDDFLGQWADIANAL